jgi:quinone-modifying oxidoreductase subunit QmoA
MKAETVQINAGAVIWATGWRPYDAAKIQPYGYGRFPNVITSVEFERLADPHGPTGGKILRPSDGKEAKDVAFIQCAGSRDENHLRHCSRICCMASLKQTAYLREAYGDGAKSTIYYIDIRAIDRFEDFYAKVRKDATVRFLKSKVARVAEDPRTGDVILHGVDTEGYHRYANRHDLTVLAIGMEPSVTAADIPAEVIVDSSGFIETPIDGGGLFGAGCATNALDVNRSLQNATAAALRAIQVINARSRAER